MRDWYLEDVIAKGELSPEEATSPEVVGFQAGKQRLYFWQLYSILGTQELEKVSGFSTKEY